MSRCFPYPPPGFCAKRDRNEAALIESSIKLQREREKAKAERKKERKREKKEKRRENKVNATQNVTESGHGEKRKRKEEKTHKWEEDKVDLKGSRYIQKRSEDEAEQLERSNLTEEHEEPVCQQNPCYSSDSTQNSNKRRRQASPVNAIRRTHGNILRIRLPSLKLEEPDVSVLEERVCSIAQRNSEIGSASTHQEEFCSTGTDVCARDKDERCSTSMRTEIFPQDHLLAATTGSTSSSQKGIQAIESLYKNLVTNWVPSPIQSERTDVDELDWLFPRKNPERRERANKASSDVLCRGSATSWPRALYLPKADIYALPFTVPF